MPTSRTAVHVRHLLLAAALATAAGCIHDHDADGTRRRDDCNDHDPTVYPGAAEVCDEKDNDCDGAVDEGLEEEWFPDSDGDSVGYTAGRIIDCRARPGFVRHDGDCDDSDPDVRPGNVERCDGKDNDCDGFVDVDGLTGTLFYPDRDHDGHGDLFAREASCTAIDGWSRDADDCADADPNVHPGAQEICNALDDDCNGLVDDVEGGCE